MNASDHIRAIRVRGSVRHTALSREEKKKGTCSFEYQRKDRRVRFIPSGWSRLLKGYLKCIRPVYLYLIDFSILKYFIVTAQC